MDNVSIQNLSFSKSKSNSIFSLLLLINLKYLDGMTVAVHESMKCFTIEHDFTFFSMCDLWLESQDSNFYLIQQLVCHILCNTLSKSYLVGCMWDIGNLNFLIENWKPRLLLSLCFIIFRIHKCSIHFVLFMLYWIH